MVVTWWKGESWCPKTVHKKINKSSDEDNPKANLPASVGIHLGKPQAD